ncbi:rifin PIR protein, putative [Plasmodium reichenowi]|uniref:Rifin PIR protein, putative n=1 Tax=Plasmodium reichenowi TaxID=5854 RepID=A0A2P9D3C0_PLARE|nr:rifin PIR protein, putative [Plasmodium reichenowi]
MKLHYTKILLFFFPLNILLTLHQVHSKNNPSITTNHTATYTSRILSEGDIQSSIYDKDAEIKSVKEKFDRQTSQRLREYDERLQDKREKRKEERDKNIQEIILKDKMDKSLAEKIEKGCLWCGCGLGGVAASVGIFGTVAVKELAKTAMTAAIATSEKAGAAAAKAAGEAAGKNVVIAELQKMGISSLDNQPLISYFATKDYTNASLILNTMNKQYNPTSCISFSSGTRSGPVDLEPFCTWVGQNSVASLKSSGKYVSERKFIQTTVETIVTDAKKAAGEATEKAIEEAVKRSTLAVEAKYASCQTAIIASVVALLIIVMVMIIIYLVLRYRRKKKMNIKAQYTKLLKE